MDKVIVRTRSSRTVGRGCWCCWASRWTWGAFRRRRLYIVARPSSPAAHTGPRKNMAESQTAMRLDFVHSVVMGSVHFSLSLFFSFFLIHVLLSSISILYSIYSPFSSFLFLLPSSVSSFFLLDIFTKSQSSLNRPKNKSRAQAWLNLLCSPIPFALFPSVDGLNKNILRIMKYFFFDKKKGGWKRHQDES